MAIQSYKMGPGVLKIGAEVGGVDVSCQVTSCTVEPVVNVSSTDAVDVLCGEALTGEETATYGARIKANLLQDLAAAGWVAWTWDHKGEEHPVVFVPNDAAARQVSGTVRIDPVVIGGTVKERPTSDLDWVFVEFPDFAAVV